MRQTQSRETIIEKKLVQKSKSMNGRCWKFVSPGLRGVPDRICLLPNGRIIFVELKKLGKNPDPLQLKRHKELRDLGFDIRVIDSEEQINEI